ncbi:hypothetical protein D3C72_2594020 [compost metagenome]
MADGLNKLTTSTLVTEDLKNTAGYSASQVSIGSGQKWGDNYREDRGEGCE